MRMYSRGRSNRPAFYNSSSKATDIMFGASNILFDAFKLICYNTLYLKKGVKGNEGLL